MSAPEKKDQRIAVMMSTSEVKRLDDWAFEKRIRSRGEAMRQLISMGVTRKIETRENSTEGKDE